MARKPQKKKSFGQRNSDLFILVAIVIIVGAILFAVNIPTIHKSPAKEASTSSTDSSQNGEVSTGPSLQDEINNYQKNIAPDQLKNDVNNIGQYATQYSTPTQSGATQQ